MFTPVGLNRLSLRIFRSSKKYNFLGIVLSHFSLSSCNYVNVFDPTVFDNALVQKYLNFIENNKSQRTLESNKLTKVLELLENKKVLEREITSLKDMSTEGDEELKKLVDLEQQEFLENIDKVKNEILTCIYSDNVDDNRNVELQILIGIGGEESKLFRNDLFKMYSNYAEFKNWECVYEPFGDYMLISGDLVYGHLMHEGGVHRVQRIPETEKSDRVHTSTCSVVVLPQPKQHEIEIHDRDLNVETMRSSGPGGQRVNKSESCVRITHIPTGIVVENQTSRFQYENKKLAIERLRNVLFNIEQNKILKDRKDLKKSQAGTNDYADKIRTYNFQQNRVTDHRLNYSTHNIRGFLSGSRDLDLMISKLKELHKKKDFFNQIQNILDSEEYKNFEKKQNR